MPEFRAPGVGANHVWRERPPAARATTRHVREEAGDYALGLAEHELVALWLLGRVPAAVLPWELLRSGRAGRGPGPDVREATFRHPSGVPLGGDIEVHLRASDFVRHGHASDPAYDGLILHLVWEDDRASERGRPTALPGAEFVLTIEVGPALDRSAARLRELVRLGPSGGEPCGSRAPAQPFSSTRRSAPRGAAGWLSGRDGAGRLVELNGWAGAWDELLVRALRSSAGRRRESAGEQRALSARITSALSAAGRPRDAPAAASSHAEVRHAEVLPALERLARTARPSALVEAIQLPGGPGRARATEIGWNAGLPLLAAAAAAYGDRELAAHVAALVDRWPAPRPYGRTDALARLIQPGSVTAGGNAATPRGGEALYAPRGGGALYAQGLLHVQDLWCERGGCGVCPLSAPDHIGGAAG